MIFLAPRKIVTKVLAYADVCIAISMEIEKVYRTQFSPHANYKLVYDGVELNNYQLKVAPQEGRAIKICMVGGFSESKNQKDLIQAIAKLNTSRSEFHVDFYGDHRTAYGEEMEALTRKYNLTSCISFKGQTNHINQLLPHYQIGVICSQYEAFGLVLVEYMLSNLAVIATDSGACPELVNDGRTGLIYHLGDSEDLAHKIQRLMDHPDLQSELSRNGRDYAAAHYTAEINARQIAEIIAGL
jgi:glycosyltransferase involved in cell wall biosynthesis